jgi:hypothetical protein
VCKKLLIATFGFYLTGRITFYFIKPNPAISHQAGTLTVSSPKTLKISDALLIEVYRNLFLMSHIAMVYNLVVQLYSVRSVRLGALPIQSYCANA